MSDHSLLSASAAERWVKCPISVTATEESRTSEAAAEGTAAHAVAEEVLRGGMYPMIGTKLEADGFEFEYTEDRHRDVAAYVDFVRSLPWAGPYSVEQRIHYGRALGTPHNLSFGTSDCFGFVQDADGQRLVICDLKYGRKPVNPRENPQAALYAGGVLEGLLPLELPRNFPVEIVIFQPRLSHKPFAWRTTVGWVEDTLRGMRPAAQAAVRFAQGKHTPEDALSFPELSGAHCMYCRRKPQCQTFQGELRKIAQPGLTVTWNPVIFAMRDSIKTYVEDLEQLALDEALKGSPLPGTKLVKGRAGNPKLIVTNDDLRAKAKERGIESMIVKVEEVWATPAKVRDAFKKAGAKQDELDKIIHTPEPKAQIADVNDPRPAFSSVATAVAAGFTGVAR